MGYDNVFQVLRTNFLNMCLNLVEHTEDDIFLLESKNNPTFQHCVMVNINRFSDSLTAVCSFARKQEY